MAQQLIELDFAKHGAKGCLRELRGLVNVVRHLDSGSVRIDNVEGDDRIHFDGDVIARDDVLGRHFEHLLAKGDANHLVEGTENQNDTRPLGSWERSAEAEDDGAFVVAKDLDRVEQIKSNDQDENQKRKRQCGHSAFLTQQGFYSSNDAAPALGSVCSRRTGARRIYGHNTQQILFVTSHAKTCTLLHRLG